MHAVPASGSKGRRRLGKLTREGRVFVLVTVGVGIAAVNTGNNLLYLLLGLLLSLLLISMVMSELVLTGLRIRRRVASRLTQDEAAVVELSIRNTKRWFPSYALEIHDGWPPAAQGHPVHLLKVPPQAGERRRYLVSLPQRGWADFAGVRVVSRYPFGLVEKAYLYPLADRVLVHPKAEPTEYRIAGAVAAGLELPAKRAGHGQEILGLREHRDGDEARTIHPLRSAALGRWVVRERGQDGHRQVTIVLAHRPQAAAPSGVAAPQAAFERLVRRATYVLEDVLNNGNAAQVVSGADCSPWVAPGGSLSPALDFLAQLDASEASHPQNDPAAMAGPAVRLS